MHDVQDNVRNAITDGAGGQLDTGSGANPKMDLLTASDAVLSSIELNATRVIAASVAGVGTFNDPVSGGGDWSAFSQLPSAAGTIAKAICYNRSGTAQFSLSVSTIAAGTGEVQLTTLVTDTAVPITTTVDPTLTTPVS